MRCIGALLVSIAIIGSFPDTAHGCTCLYYAAPVCFVYADSEAVFIGKVRQIKKTDGYDRVRIDVIEAFKGVHTRSIEITSGDLSCDFEGFVRGQSYLVFAYKHKQDGLMRCSGCGPTDVLTDAVADVAYIRGLSKALPKPAILGRVARDWKVTPIAGIKVTVEGYGKTYTAVTDEEGRFAVEVDQPGAYRVGASAPDGGMIVHNDPYGSTLGRADDHSRVVHALVVTVDRCGYVEFDVFLPTATSAPRGAAELAHAAERARRDRSVCP